MSARRFRRTGRVLLPLALALLFLPGPCGYAQTDAAAPAAPAPTLTESFPPGTIAVLRIKDVSRMLDWIAKSPFSSVATDPELKPLWEQITGMLKQMNGQAQQQVGVDFLAMLSGIKGEVAVGLTRFQISGPVPSPGLMFTVDCRDGAEAFRKDVDALLKLLPEPVFSRSERELQGVNITTFTPAKKEGRRRDPLQVIGPVHLAWVGSVLAIGNDKSAFDKFVQLQKGGEQIDSLGQSANWRDTMNNLGGTGDFTMYVNIQAIAELLEAATGMMPREVGPVIAALGLDEFPALGSVVQLQPEGMTSRFIVRYTGDGKSGLGSLMAFKKTDLSIPAWVPDDAMQAMIFNYDFPKAFDGVLGLVREAGEEHYEGMQEGLDEFQKEFGMSLQEDLIASLTGPVIMVSQEPPGGTPTPSPMSRRMGVLFGPMSGAQSPTLFGVGIRNRKHVEQFLEVFETMGAEVTEYMGATIFSPPGMGPDMPVFEAAITDNYLLLGMGMTSVVRPTLQRMGGRESGFAGLKGVRDATSSLPKEGIGLAVTNMGKTMSAQLNLLKLLISAGAGAEDLAKFPVPSSSVFEKYFGYTAGVFTFSPGTGLVADSYWQFKRP